MPARPAKSPFLPLLLAACALSSSGSPARAADESPAPSAAMSEMKVNLFGQPCLLQGPFDPAMLKTIHSISPEQVQAAHSPRFSIADQKQLLTLHEKVESITSLPPELDRYREKLLRRVDAQLTFFDVADEAVKTRKPQTLIKLAQSNCARDGASSRLKARCKEFEQTVTKGGLSASRLGALFEIYGSTVEPDPEEEFHRAIRKIKVQYVCSYEEAPSRGASGQPAKPAKSE